MCRRMPTDEDIPARARGILIEFGSRPPQSALFKGSPWIRCVMHAYDETAFRGIAGGVNSYSEIARFVSHPCASAIIRSRI